MRPRWKRCANLFGLRDASWHPFTCCDGIRRRPRWWISAPRYPALPERLAAPALERERCSLPTSATDSRHAHLTDSSTPEVATRFREIHHVRWRRAPADDPGHDVFDDTPRASAAMRCTRPPMRRARMPPDPAGLPIDIEPTGDTPRPRRCLPRTGRTMRPLTPCRDARAPKRGTHRQDHLPRRPVKDGGSRGPRRLPSTSARSTDPACARQVSNASPPPAPGLRRPGPASDAPSPHAPGGGGARHGRFQALFTPGRTLPRAARRLLQSKRSASTTDGPSKPRSTSGRSTCIELPILERVPPGEWGDRF